MKHPEVTGAYTPGETTDIQALGHGLPRLFRLEPFFALCLLFVWIMAVEIGVMLALPLIVSLSAFQRSLADALTLLLGVAPAVYLLGFRPLQLRVAERKRFIDAQEERLQILSESVRERSEEIASVNKAFEEQVAGRRQDEKEVSQLAAIVESSDDAIIGRNPDGLITVWSTAAERLYGYSAEEAKGRYVSIITPSDRADELRRIWDIARGEEPAHHYETVQITKDGRQVDVSVSVFPIVDTDGKPIGSGMIVRDVTEGKRLERAMEVAAREWRATIDGIRDGVLVLDQALRVTRCNRAMQEQIGAPFSEILGHPCDEFIGCKAEDAEDPFYIQALRSRKEQSRVFAQGERWIRATAYPLLDPANVVTGMVCVLSDITEKRKATEDLRQTAQTLEALIEASPLAITVLDPHGMVKLWNPASERIFGWSASEVIGQPFPAVPEGLRGEVELVLKESFQGMVITGREFRRQRKDGSLIDISLSNAPLVDASGKIVASLGIIADITDRKIAEEALRESEKRVRELAVESIRAQEEERHWAADAVHDRIAQDLVAVHQQLQILKTMVRADPGAQQTVRKALELQQKTIAEARAIMKDLYSPVLDTYGLIPLMEEELRQFQEESGCQAVLKARRSVRFPKHLEGSLYRIFHEGLANIAKHSPQAKKVEVSLTSGPSGVTLKIRDDGPGFDAEAAMLSNPSGGLIGMRRRAEVISGRFYITSAPGRGTTVTVHVPAKYVMPPRR